jgi:hypothetical protein
VKEHRYHRHHIPSSNSRLTVTSAFESFSRVIGREFRSVRCYFRIFFWECVVCHSMNCLNRQFVDAFGLFSNDLIEKRGSEQDNRIFILFFINSGGCIYALVIIYVTGLSRRNNTRFIQNYSILLLV